MTKTVENLKSEISSLEKKLEQSQNHLQRLSRENASHINGKIKLEREISKIEQNLDQQVRRHEKTVKMIMAELELSQKERTELEQKLNQATFKLHYDANFPVPKFLLEHKTNNPNSFYIQITGSRGTGKSSFVNYILKKLGNDEKANVGVNETTSEPTFYNITRGIESLPAEIKSVFIVDMPGIGGQKINRAGYFFKDADFKYAGRYSSYGVLFNLETFFNTKFF